MRKAIFGALLAGSALISTVAHAGPFDGNWSVLIVTDKGDCDRAYRYAVNIADGHVRYAGDASVNMAGTVGSNGAVQVSLRMGDRGAQGSGKLAANGGGGTWQGSGPNASCAGHWEAEKR